MKLHVRFFITILSLFVVPILFLGFIVNHSAESIILNKTLDHLKTSAKVLNVRLVDQYERSIERLRGVTSRTQLRLSLRQYYEDGLETHKVKLRRIIDDAKNSISDTEQIHVLDLQGRIVVSTDDARDGGLYEKNIFFEQGLIQDYLDVLKKDPADLHFTKMVLAGPMRINSETIGVLIIEMNSNILARTVEENVGAGQTEDLLVARRTRDGDAEFLFSRKFESEISARAVIPREETNVPITQALLKNESIFDNVIDYRGEQILAATSYIQTLDWGVVAKIDRKEFLAPVYSARKIGIMMTSVTIVLNIIFSFILSNSIVSPILSLQRGAENVVKGGHGAYLDPYMRQFDDEIGSLAKSIDQMTKTLLEANTRLEEKIRFRTQELEYAKTGLEKEVRKRTREFEAKSNELQEAKANLEKEVEARTKSLQDKLEEVERMNKLMVGRELMMVRLKEQIEKLKGQGR